ncbi:GspE/PulE family protein [Planctomycetota bacterium]
MPVPGRKTLGQILVDMKFIIPEQLDEALAYQKQKPDKSLGEILVEKGYVTPQIVTAALAKQEGMKFVKLSSGNIPQEVIQAIPKSVALVYKIIPLKKKEHLLTIAVGEPLDLEKLDMLRIRLDTELECVLAIKDEIIQMLTKYYGSSGDDFSMLLGELTEQEVSVRKGILEDEGEMTEDSAPIIKFVTLLLQDAVKMRVSDIHIEPMENKLRIRYRIDGVCREMEPPPKRIQGAVLSRIKLMSSMNIAERRRPQDGRIPLVVAGRQFDIRVSALPGVYGESVVMRLLEKESDISLKSLGFYGEDYERFKTIIKKPNGIFLITGPTGSGKTTTLFAVLKELNKPDTKIITAENPVEYVIPGVNQCMVKAEIGFTFANIIRSMLHQNPDIILVGEIRDQETAASAIQAALTGHLVFSTLHTNDAPSAITRLLDMEVKAYLIATSVLAIMAQRLIRMLCPKCKKPHQPSIHELKALDLTEKDIEGHTLYQAVGCPLCKEGYKGRQGIFELLEMDTKLREMTFKQEPTAKLQEQAKKNGMISLLEDGIRKVLTGVASVEEVLLMTRREDIDYT